MILIEAWEKRDKLYAEGNKLYAEGNKLYAEGNKLYAEAVIDWNTGNVEGNPLPIPASEVGIKCMIS